MKIILEGEVYLGIEVGRETAEGKSKVAEAVAAFMLRYVDFDNNGKLKLVIKPEIFDIRPDN